MKKEIIYSGKINTGVETVFALNKKLDWYNNAR